MIPTLRSLPDPDALSAYLADRYGLGFTGCTLLRSLVNDVYELTTGDARYILKLYRYDGRDPGEIRWETGLSAHLNAAGLLVPRVLFLPGERGTGRVPRCRRQLPFAVPAATRRCRPSARRTDRADPGRRPRGGKPAPRPRSRCTEQPRGVLEGRHLSWRCHAPRAGPPVNSAPFARPPTNCSDSHSLVTGNPEGVPGLSAHAGGP